MIKIVIGEDGVPTEVTLTQEEIAEWEIDQNQPQPEIFNDLQPYQFRAMLKLSGKQDDLYTYIESLPEPDKTVAQSKLEYSLVFKYDNDLVQAARAAMNLPEAEFKALWSQAASIL